MEINLLPDERLLIETEPKGLALTTHRARSEVREQGRVIIKSIMLEAIASSAITREQVIQIESAGATIRKSIRSNNLRRACEFLDATERAKDERYLLGIVAMVTQGMRAGG